MQLLVTLIAPTLFGATGGGLDDTGVRWIPSVINVVLHFFLVGSFFAFGYFLIRLANEARDMQDRVGRFMSLFIGALIVVATSALGASYSEFIIDSLGDGRSPAFRFFGAVIPGVAGLVLGYYMTRGMRRASELAVRLLLIIGTFCVTQFALMYAAAVEQESGELDSAVAPNVSFVVGVGLVMAINLGIKRDDEAAEAKNNGLRAATDWLQRRGAGQASTSQPPSTSKFLED